MASLFADTPQQQDSASASASSTDALLHQRLRKWAGQVDKTVEQDGWGQQVEAAEGYAELAATIRPQLGQMPLSRGQRETLDLCLACALLRSRGLLSSNGLDGGGAGGGGSDADAVQAFGAGPSSGGFHDDERMPSLDKMKEVRDVFSAVACEKSNPRFDHGISSVQLEVLRRADSSPGSPKMKKVVTNTGFDHDPDLDFPGGGGRGGEAKDGGAGEGGRLGPGMGSLQPRPAPAKGCSQLSITVRGVGLKDAQTYIQPFLSVSVRDRRGEVVERVQDTPWASTQEPTLVVFDQTIHLQTCVEDLKAGDCAIFFEFKHYKPKKQMVSCRCWSFLEMDEIRVGATNLEIYRKPMDPKRKRIRLHSVKKLYMHLTQEICDFR
jgi:hypothetical protein